MKVFTNINLHQTILNGNNVKANKKLIAYEGYLIHYIPFANNFISSTGWLIFCLNDTSSTALILWC
jgi:hypothetical protein